MLSFFGGFLLKSGLIYFDVHNSLELTFFIYNFKLNCRVVFCLRIFHSPHNLIQDAKKG